MQDILSESLKKLKKKRVRRTRMISILLVLSFVVSLDVFWFLRQPGLTLAGDADCGITEHTHTRSCQNDQTPCRLIEHVHTIECYSDETADTEWQFEWQKMFEEYPYTGNLSTDLVGIAKTQVGYTESKLNFTINQDGMRQGYTRYGAWYGTPYSKWSSLFVAFCLHYSGAPPSEFPINTGALAMAEQWRRLGKFAAFGRYTPMSGDLVFFKDNTVGIVAEVYSATMVVIRGDIENTVKSDILSLNDALIAGWGLVNDVASKENSAEIASKPAVYIVEGGIATRKMQRFSLRSSQTIKDLLAYLEENGGSYFFTLLDMNNQELPKDAAGNYIVQANTRYNLTISYHSPNGFWPDTYQHQISNGLLVDGGEGVFELKDDVDGDDIVDTEVGSWVVTDTGLITFVFNKNMTNHSDITISTTLKIQFPEQDDPIDFDGKITVSVEKPPPQTNPTVVSKWGHKGGTTGSTGTDPSKIYWGIEIIGNKDSQIPGSIVTDRIIDGEWSGIHRFTASDIAAGLSFGVSGDGKWHEWQITADDPHLIWTETGWTYKMPQTAVCRECGEVELGNEGWYYYIHYSSTPNALDMAGEVGYENDVTVDGAYGYMWVNFQHVKANGEITKNGSFVSDAGGGGFQWEFKATIPGRVDGKRAEYHWYIMDSMRLMNSSGQIVGLVENDSHLATVLATYNGTTFVVPRVGDATANDLFAWDNGWSATENGINYGREFNLLTRCRCTKDTCHWESGCGEYWYQKADGTYATNGFCQCWTVTENVTFTFVYKTTDLDVVESYGGLGYRVQNIAELFYIPPNAVSGASVARSEALVTIPGLFKKELTHDFDGYTANYKVTINESKLVLTNGLPLRIHDVMTDTLAYISGSLIITAEDAAGNITTLQQGVDYTVSYDGTGNQTDQNGKEVHVLDITILRPQPVMYTLDYDATLVLPKVITGAVKYTNSASITLWDETITDNTVEKVYADINIASKSYTMKIFKTSALTGEPLGGATFGFYNENGGLITTAVTNNNGELLFHTNVIEGVILREHVLYYMQELQAPAGYQLDDTKYWFYFCDKVGDFCATCNAILQKPDAIRIPFEQTGNVNIPNQLMHYDLPATGGPGIYPLILVSVLLIITPLVYRFIHRRKRERRGTG